MYVCSIKNYIRNTRNTYNFGLSGSFQLSYHKSLANKSRRYHAFIILILTEYKFWYTKPVESLFGSAHQHSSALTFTRTRTQFPIFCFYSA